jgi:hypothetical protein
MEAQSGAAFDAPAVVAYVRVAVGLVLAAAAIVLATVFTLIIPPLV